MNLLELWWLLEKPAFQEVGSGFHRKFDQLLDHNWVSCESVGAYHFCCLVAFSYNLIKFGASENQKNRALLPFTPLRLQPYTR